MSTSRSKDYHHGDLRNALVAAAIAMMERGETFSIRAVARKAGVSQTAPYRHFPDRTHLESAIAAVGFRDLGEQLARAHKQISSPSDLPEIAVLYVHFALRRPHMFRLMFGTECDGSSDERVQASEALHEQMQAALARVYPDRTAKDLEKLATGLWCTAHGLASLHLDGKLGSANDNSAESTDVDQAIRQAFAAVVPAR